MSTSLAALRDQFAALCRIRSPGSGRITASGKFLNVTSTWGFRVPAMKKDLKVNQVALVNPEDFSVVSVVDTPSSESEGQSTVFSPDGKLSAVFTVITEGKDKKYFVRIVDTTKNVDVNIFNLSAKKLHGNVHISGEFGTNVFSNSGKYLLYTAERDFKPVEFFDADLEKKEKKDDKTEGAKEQIGDKYIWKESFGEQIFEVVDPVLCILTVETGEVKVLDSIPKNLYPVEKLFTLDETFVICAAVDAPHYKLGLKFCSNRHYSIGKISIHGNEFDTIAEKMIGLDILRMTKDGIIYGFARSNDKQSHQGSYSFYKIDTVDGTVERISTKDIFMPTVQRRVFTNAGKFVFTALDAGYLKIFCFDLKSKQLDILSPENVSQIVLDVFEDWILVNRSGNDQTPELWLGRLADDNQIKWLPIWKPNSYDVQHTCIDADEHSFLMMPKSIPEGDGKVPLVVILHGGPHGASIKSWGRRIAPLLINAGCAVLQVNYPGSVGFDDDYVQQLPGKVGDLDVKYCVKTIDETVGKFKQLNGHKIAIYGASHGGFLVSHLAGKYPEKFKAVVALNPVLNIRTMFDISDIPDWCAFETYGKPLLTGPLAGEANAEMVHKSPIATAHKIRAPFLLVISGKDLRVPPHFRTFVRELRINGVTHKVLYYPETNHALGEIEVEIDLELNTVLWIKQHLGIEN